MGKIHVLDFSVANLIAAGEVVDRPSSAIKEMIENSLDASATSVTVEIQRGGVVMLRVTDNGCGIAREDVPTAILRHATSKILTASDLDGIRTLGFRGEALAAIASVSKLRILTRTAEEACGTLLTAENGGNVTLEDAGCPLGTTVIAEELFANLPARRKFLKSDAAETASVCSAVEKMALSRPDVAFKLVTDGALRLSTPGDGKLQSAVYAVFGREFAAGLIPVNGSVGDVDITGFIGTPSNVRKNRNFENLFLNGRFIRSKTVSAALDQAYDSYIPEDKFPVCVLNVGIHPSLVDVNVHPAKLEVKFSNEKMIFDAVYTAVRTTLSEKVPRPALDWSDKVKSAIAEAKIVSPFVPLPDRQKPPRKPSVFPPLSGQDKKTPASGGEEKSPFPLSPGADPGENDAVSPGGLPAQTPLPVERGAPSPASSLRKDEGPSPEKKPADPQREKAPARRESASGENRGETSENRQTPPGQNPIPPYKIVGDAFYSYVIVETEDRLLLVDKHAAHERILFEELKARMNREKSSSQLLLLPLRTELTAEEQEAAIAFRDSLSSLGFSFEPCEEEDSHALRLTQIPSGIRISEASAMFSDLCSDLVAGRDPALSASTVFEKALYQVACKSAVKAGRISEEEDNRYIIDKLFSCDGVRYCPHGRPVAFEITRSWLDGRFGRT